MRVFHSVKISDDAEVGAARRALLRYAATLEFSETELAELEIVAQELGTNAVRYATGGGWLHWSSAPGTAPGVELCYWDKGPGIHDLDRAVRDGVSTSGSLGGGLGAIHRLTDEFDVYSTERAATARLSLSRRTTYGTIILARKWVAASGVARRGPTSFAERLGVWSRPQPGEDANGDAYFVSRHGESTLLAVVDGLGHGRGAQIASRAALDVLEGWRGEPLDDIFYAVHDALRATRGGVMGACVVNHQEETFHYAGVGNVEVRVFDAPQPVRPVSVNGTLGARLSGVRVWSHPWAEGATIVMATDGISASWDIASYPGLLRKNPQLLAGVLLRDFGRDSDDATVLVAR